MKIHVILSVAQLLTTFIYFSAEISQVLNGTTSKINTENEDLKGFRHYDDILQQCHILYGGKALNESNLMSSFLTRFPEPHHRYSLAKN